MANPVTVQACRLTLEGLAHGQVDDVDEQFAVQHCAQQQVCLLMNSDRQHCRTADRHLHEPPTFVTQQRRQQGESLDDVKLAHRIHNRIGHPVQHRPACVLQRFPPGSARQLRPAHVLVDHRVELVKHILRRPGERWFEAPDEPARCRGTTLVARAEIAGCRPARVDLKAQPLTMLRHGLVAHHTHPAGCEANVEEAAVLGVNREDFSALRGHQHGYAAEHASVRGQGMSGRKSRAAELPPGHASAVVRAGGPCYPASSCAQWKTCGTLRIATGRGSSSSKPWRGQSTSARARCHEPFDRCRRFAAACAADSARLALARRAPRRPVEPRPSVRGPAPCPHRRSKGSQEAARRDKKT
jgi:hypothetical protein